MKIASEAISAAPDIRQDKVQEVKSSVDNGTYQIKPEQIAEKIIGYNINELV
jgi:negative regulator of flagellin synthesis FlgM